jgi:hypothetical protein
MTFESVLQNHLVRYPSMQIQDVYKLMHQASMGSEHAVTDAVGVQRWMERELAEMGAGPDEPMLDPISGDGQMVRVHLRPFVSQGGNPESLLDAFVRTANEFRGNKQALEEYWKIASDLLNFPANQIDDFMQSIRTQGYPAVHHSTEFERLYRPAYRVVWHKFFP